MEVSDFLKEMALEKLKEMPAYEKLKNDLDSILKYQKALYVLVNNRDEKDESILRVGTVLSFRVLEKLYNGKNPKSFTSEDWKDIADAVSEYGVLRDGQKYTESVFDFFASYIDFSVDINIGNISEVAANEIKALANDIRNDTDRLQSGEITESYYVDECLWTSFEAMIKLLAAYKSNGLSSEFSEFVQAVADISIQYGRYRMYQRELSLVNEYLAKQEILDEQLNKEYDEYIESIRESSEEFNTLLDHAFSDDFENILNDSAIFALRSGVDKERILDSKEKIDSFFL